jgi:murein DD-endopeptidase MepM/ murein hydrolase activator NlpD
MTPFGPMRLAVCALAIGSSAASARPTYLSEIKEVFPAQFVKAAYGQMTQGGLVILELQPNTALEFEGEAIVADRNLAVIGFDRDHGQQASFRFQNRPGADSLDLALAIAPQSYDIQRIDGLPPKYVSPPPEALEKIKRDVELKQRARRDITADTAFAEGFRWPLTGVITGHYGSQRFYNGEARRPHYGVDIAAPAGTAIIAAAPGRVTLAEEDMYFEGGLVFIDHGQGLTSIYMHMGKISVTPGMQVQAGMKIGEVGSTGRSTGAHLDWRLQWRGRQLNPALVVPPMSEAEAGPE